MAIMQSYDLKGVKLSFANWISNLSPTDTPFVSMTGKESVDQVKYQWQIDRLSKAASNAVVEGSDAVDGVHTSTEVMESYTQILRKAVRVTDSAKATGLYGRSNELQYQMEKAGLEIKRDLEYMFLTNGKGSLSTKDKVRTTFGFRGLVGTDEAGELMGSKPDVDTGAVVVAETTAVGVFSEQDLFNMTTQLYLAGAKVDTLMIHPKHMHLFETLIVRGGVDRARMFENLSTKVNTFVTSFKDPLGQVVSIVPNRFMPESAIYFLSAKDWTQMIFRSPERVPLAKSGSNEKWMIEMEVGLRHRNPYASGIIYIKQVEKPVDETEVDALTDAEVEYILFAYGISSEGLTTVEEKKGAIKTAFGIAITP